ncbi:MAG TPA: hypothetical protein VFU31_18060 [Candidatus Binatia bacterium]|nr:hypothetical protein [Candidatus Binatia bacterium]
MKVSVLCLASAIAAGSAGLAWAQATTTLTSEAAQMDSLAASHGQTKVVGKISSDFSHFLQKVDGPSVVSGLRNGQWTYSTPSSTPTGAPTTTTLALPTGKTGYGNTYISLALAKQQLSQYGITQPTQSELQAALVGGQITKSDGTTVELKGILTMRSQGMGWGEIAKQTGAKSLGSIVSEMKKANQGMTTGSASSKGNGTVNASGKQARSAETGVVSGSGKAHGNSGQGVSGKNSSGAGIVSASGKSTGNGNAYGHGKGIVTGSGQAGASSGVTTAGSHGNSGQAKGHNK